MGRARNPSPFGDLPFEWVQWAVRTLQRLGIDETNYRNEIVRDRVLEGITACFWRAVVNRAASRQLTYADIGNRLGVGRTTSYRWEKEGLIPHADKVLGAIVLALREEVEGIPFPRLNNVVWEAARHTMAEIRRKEGNGTIGPGPERDEWVATRWFVRHPLSPEFLKGKPDKEALEGALSDTATYMLRRFPGSRLCLSGNLRAALKQWAKPYALFRIGLTPALGGLDVDEH